jgi:hypothetical protein
MGARDPLPPFYLEENRLFAVAVAVALAFARSHIAAQMFAARNHAQCPEARQADDGINKTAHPNGIAPENVGN